MEFLAYPPCPKVTTGTCTGVLVPVSIITKGLDDKDHILPVGRWVCTACGHEVGMAYHRIGS